jgi:hypothetical protein
LKGCTTPFASVVPKRSHFDPILQKFADTKEERKFRKWLPLYVDNMRNRARESVNVSARFREGAFYNVISNRPHSADHQRHLERFDTLLRNQKCAHILGHGFAERVAKDASQRERMERSRSMNRVSFERFQEGESRGFDIINNIEYNAPFSVGQSTHFPPRVKPRRSPWSTMPSSTR